MGYKIFIVVLIMSNILGVLTVYYKQGDPSEGFNASYSVVSCEENCSGNHRCINGQCICKEGMTGVNCSLIMCPHNCSAVKKQGICDKVNTSCSILILSFSPLYLVLILASTSATQLYLPFSNNTISLV